MCRLICPHMLNYQPSPVSLALEYDDVVSFQLCFGNPRGRSDCFEVVSTVIGEVSRDFGDQTSWSEVGRMTCHRGFEECSNCRTAAKAFTGPGQENGIGRIQSEDLPQFLLPPVHRPLFAHARKLRRRRGSPTFLFSGWSNGLASELGSGRVLCLSGST